MSEFGISLPNRTGTAGEEPGYRTSGASHSDGDTSTGPSTTVADGETITDTLAVAETIADQVRLWADDNGRGYQLTIEKIERIAPDGTATVVATPGLSPDASFHEFNHATARVVSYRFTVSNSSGSASDWRPNEVQPHYGATYIHDHPT